MPTRTAPAKINLFLHVLAREDSGYHGIETLFCGLALADEISVEKAGSGIALEIAGDVPGAIEDNLVYRAAGLFFGRIGLPPAVRIRLIKNIPVGAGLGGGSSDAAATLLALNALFGDPVDAGDLVGIGGALGSDVAYFVTGADLALAWGRGGRLLTLDALPERPILLAVPSERMPTAEAYRLLAAQREGRPPTLARAVRSAELHSWEDIAALAANDFEEIVFGRIDGLEHVRDAIRAGGASIAMLSGSGSALFGVFDDFERRSATAARLRDRFPDMTFIETVSTAARQR